MLVFAALLAGQKGDELPRALRSRLAALLPDAKTVGGKPGPEAVYDSANLYRYLDGGAEEYHLRGFVALIHREYKTASAEIEVDIYDMGLAANALEMSRVEGGPDCRPIEIGSGGYAREGMLNFTQGKYYVRLTAFSDAGGTPVALEKAARSISARMPPAPR
jgi:hypothetical protein